MTKLPLSRFKVLDLTAHRAGPTAVRQLADWGADVIKIERPGDSSIDASAGPNYGSDYQNLHRNKRSLTLNLKSEKGREVFLKMAQTADVVVENYRSDVKRRLRIDYDHVAAVNPRIIYASISGFGQTGPDATRPGVDQIAQGMGGLMSVTGRPGHGPVRVGIPIADLTAGLLLAQAILMAIIQREQTSQGQWVHTSLLEAIVFMLDFQAARWLIDSDVPGQAGNDHPTAIPTGVFPTADGHINIAASGGELWKRCCEALGLPQLLSHPDYATRSDRSRHRATLHQEISDITKTEPTAHWISTLTQAGVPCGPINRVDQTFDELQVQHLGIVRRATHPKLGELQLVGQPIQMTDAAQPARLRPTPDPGEHSGEILASNGFDEQQIAQLRREGVV